MKIKEAKKEAHKRIRNLEKARRKEIVDAVGEERSKIIVIKDNGGLCGKGVDGNTANALKDELKKAGVDARPQWMELPMYKQFESIDTFNKAGKPLQRKDN